MRLAPACAMRRPILPVAATVTYTTSGSSALRAARERPESFDPGADAVDIETARRLALVWGTYPIQTPADRDAVGDRGVRLRDRGG